MISRLKSSMIKQLTWYRVLSYAVFLATIFITISIIGKLDRSINLSSLRQIALMAALFGLLLSLLKNARSTKLITLSLFGGIIVSYTTIGHLIQPFFSFLQSWSYNLYASIQSLFSFNDIFPNPARAKAQWIGLEQGIQVLYERQIDWLLNLPKSTYDPVSLNLTWGIIVWLTTIWIYWHLVRKKQAVVGFAPPLVILAATNPHIEPGLAWLYLILGAGLFMTVLSNQATLEGYWHRMMFTSSRRIRGRTVQFALYLSVTLVVFAGAITSPQIEEVIDEIRERRNQSEGQEEQGSSGEPDAAVTEEKPSIEAEEVLDETAIGRFPNLHLIGSGPELSEIEVLHARVQEPDSRIASRYYFRSATYEYYNLNGWQNLGRNNIFIPPEESFEIETTPNEKLLYQEVTLLRDFPKGNLMYVIGELTAANVYYHGAFHTKFVNNTYTDLSAAVTVANQYKAFSSTPNFGENDLRNTSQNYPAWIENKYLQVPNSIPDRVYELAFSLTATQPTPYDRVLAIESYLREFEYTLEIAPPTRSRDLVDHFLFDLQKGYCDYFASAMVILSRAAGIPARLATGYLASTYDPETGHFVVTADQAHSWAEVYFPEYGWVTFEPTAGQPALIRQDVRELLPENMAVEPQLDIQIQEPEKSGFQLIPANLFILAGEISLLVITGLAVFHWMDQWNLSRMEPDRSLSKIYSQLRELSKRMGVRTKSTDTPLEFSAILTKKLETLSKNNLMHSLLKSTPQKAASIIEVCSQAAYSSHPLDDEKVRQTVHYWGNLRWQFLMARFLVRLQPVHARIKRVWFRLQQLA